MPVLDGFTLRSLGRVEYAPTVEAMQRFTAERTPDTRDELWLLEHPPVFTLGQAGRREHLLRATEIPVVQTDRGGQITYHGPGQLVAYVLMDLRRRGFFVKGAVDRIEQAVIDLLAAHGIAATRRAGAPGVYLREESRADPGTEQAVAGAKISALGLKVRNGCTYHGVSLNVAMDLAPFALINPCGYAGMAVTDMASCLAAMGASAAAAQFPADLADELACQLATHLAPTLHQATP